MSNQDRPRPLVTAGLRLSSWFERWFPDAFVLALVAVTVIFVGCVLMSGSVADSARWFGSGFWDLTTFTMQVAMIIVTGYAVATAPPVHKLINRLAGIPTNGRNATAFVAVFSMASSLISWSLSLVFSALLARAVARRLRTADYRALGAAAYLGVGSVWALGLSSSAALIMAAPASLPRSIAAISGVIPLSQTLGLWQSMFTAVILVVVSTVVAYSSAPDPSAARGIDAMELDEPAVMAAAARPQTPGEWLEYSPLLTIVVTAFGVSYLVREVIDSGPGVLLELNHYVFAFLVAGLLLHWRPRAFVRAIALAAPSVAGVLIQYPLYAGAVRMMTESGLAKRMAEMFVAVSTPHSFPVMIGAYSAFLGLFVPSAGGKWIIEAPYVLGAANTLKVHLGWVVQTYNATEALANLVHPFWMLPLLGILGLKARDIIGYSVLQFIVHVPLVLFLVWVLNYTLQYAPPVLSAVP